MRGANADIKHARPSDFFFSDAGPRDNSLALGVLSTALKRATSERVATVCGPALLAVVHLNRPLKMEDRLSSCSTMGSVRPHHRNHARTHSRTRVGTQKMHT